MTVAYNEFGVNDMTHFTDSIDIAQSKKYLDFTLTRPINLTTLKPEYLLYLDTSSPG